MTVNAEFAAPLTAPMHAMLQSALTPYLDGDLDASDGLIEALLEIIAVAERTPDLIGTLYAAIKTLPPTTDLMAPMHQAIGAALELDTALTPASGYGAARPTYAAARTGSGASRDGSVGAKIKAIFEANPGATYRVGDLVKELGGAHSGGAVGAALNGMTARGEAVQVGDKPKLYTAATDPAATAQGTDTPAGAAPDAPGAESAAAEKKAPAKK